MKDKLVEYVETKFNSLTTFDAIRLFKIAEIIQYCIIYAIFSLILGIMIEYFFVKMFPYDENSGIIRLSGEITFQCILLSLAVYYVRKIVQIIPFIFIYSKYYNANYDIWIFRYRDIDGYIYEFEEKINKYNIGDTL